MARTRATPPSRKTLQSQNAHRPAITIPTDDRLPAVPTAKTIQVVFGRTEPSKKEIRDRAYYIYLARGGVNGDPVSDWVRAERELREELRGAARAGRRF
jgi:hypothetical protein